MPGAYNWGRAGISKAAKHGYKHSEVSHPPSFSEVSLRSLYLGGGRLVAGPLIALFLLVTHHTLSHVELVERVDLAQVVEGSRGEEQDVGDQITTVELERHQPVHGLHAFLRGTEAVLAEAGGLVGFADGVLQHQRRVIVDLHREARIAGA